LVGAETYQFPLLSCFLNDAIQISIYRFISCIAKFARVGVPNSWKALKKQKSSITPCSPFPMDPNEQHNEAWYLSNAHANLNRIMAEGKHLDAEGRSTTAQQVRQKCNFTFFTLKFFNAKLTEA
jgi:hypothetical protein